MEECTTLYCWFLLKEVLRTQIQEANVCYFLLQDKPPVFVGYLGGIL